MSSGTEGRIPAQLLESFHDVYVKEVQVILEHDLEGCSKLLESKTSGSWNNTTNDLRLGKTSGGLIPPTEQEQL